jgi:iron complex transport system ATP-binding protein
MELMLSVEKVSCGYGKNVILSDVNLAVGKGDILCILGPNGVGKTTLFKTILGFIHLKSGDILVDHKSIKSMSFKNKAKLLGYVPQIHNPPFPFKVFDVVLMGRTAHIDSFSSPGREDERIVMECMESLHITNLRDRIYTELSGGERQLVLIARALAQQPRILIMDEPTSNLDFGNQIRVLKQINDLAKQGLTVVMTSHFPNHAYLCASSVALVKSDKSIQIGTSEEIITEKNLKETYGIDVKITSVNDHKGNEVKACIPLLDD